MEEKNVNDETQVEEESQDQVEDKKNDTEETKEESKEEAKEESGNAEYWKNKYYKQVRISSQEKGNKEEKSINQAPNNERLERLELRQDGYSEKVIDEIMELGGKTALSNKIVKKAVDDLVVQERNEDAASTDGSSESRTVTKVTLDELKGMSSAEMEKHLPKA